MNYLKTIITTSLCLIIMIIAVIYFSFSGTFLLKKTLEKVQLKQYEASYISLSKAKSSLPSHQHYLYLSYIKFLDKKPEEAKECLKKAFNAAQKSSHNNKDLAELHLLQATYNILENNFIEAENSLLLADNIIADKDLLEPLQGLLLYKTEQFSQALEIWQPNWSPKYISSWQKTFFNSFLNENNIDLYRAHCQIENDNNDFLKNFDTLDRVPENNAEFYYFLKGVSILKSAEKKSTADTILDIKNALIYFNKIDLNDTLYEAERKIIFNKILQHYLRIANSDFKIELLDIVEYFEGLHAETMLTQISDNILKNIDPHTLQENYLADIKTSEYIAPALHSSSIKSIICPKLEENILSCLEKEEHKNAWHYWQILSRIDQSSDTKNELNGILVEKIKQLATSNIINTNLISSYLSFMHMFEHSPKKRTKLSLDLLGISDKLWQSINSSTKSIEIIKLVNHLSYLNDDQNISAIAVENITHRFIKAKRDDDIERLALLKDAIDYFKLDPNKFISNSDIANILSDAKYYCRAGKYQEAFSRALLINKFTDDQEDALNIAGSIAYINDDFSTAEHFLKKLKNPTCKITEAIAISELFNDHNEGYQKLLNLHSKTNLTEKAFLALGYWELLQDNNQKSIEWLSNVKNSSITKQVLLCHAHYNLGEYNKVLAELAETPTYIREINTLKTIATISDLSLNNISLDENIITSLDSKNDDICWDIIPNNIKAFYKKENNNPRFAIEKYWRCKKKYEKTIKYISKNQSPPVYTNVQKNNSLVNLYCSQEPILQNKMLISLCCDNLL